MSSENDFDLVAKALHGSGKAFRALVERYTPVVYTVVRGVMGGGSDVEDTVQDTFIKIYRGLPAFRGESKLSTWIFRIARNEAINALSRKRPELRPQEELESRPTKICNPHDAYQRKRDRELLERMISRLAEKHRTALELRYMGERSYSEISEIMNVPIGTVKTYIHRAKAELKRLITASSGIGAEKGRPAR